VEYVPMHFSALVVQFFAVQKQQCQMKFFGIVLRTMTYNCCAFSSIKVIAQLGTITASSPIAFVSPN